MTITLAPSELGFKRPFNHEVTQVLRLGNKGGDPLAFKVKTTAPKQYCVRPNSGRIEPGHEVEVQVLLQAMKEDPPLDARCKDKFLVQSIAITPERESGNIASIWASVESLARDQIEERKIRVVFLPGDDSAGLSTPNPKQINGNSDIAPAYESSTPLYASPAAQGTPSNARQMQDSAGKAASSVVAATSATAAAVSNAIPTSGEELKAQLAQANEKIKVLTGQVQDQGLRQRKAEAVAQDSKEKIASGLTGQGTVQQPAEGVPVQIVAALCLLSFLLAYFFF